MSHRSADASRGSDGHLTAERLAALADAPPTAPELAHLERCAPCRDEQRAFAALLGRARAERTHVAPPLTSWASLSASLRDEGLLAAAPAAATPATGPAAGPQLVPGGAPAAPGGEDVLATRRRRIPAWAGRAAAAVLLLLGGVAAGRLSAGESPVPGLALDGAAPAAPAVAALADTAATPRSAEEAMAILTRAERDYRTATAFLVAESDVGGELDRPEIYQRRLAVMDEVAALTRAALYEAPHDPVLNQYYLASIGAREATLQQLGGALPAGTQLNRF